jgi:DNA repair protein RadD
MIVLRPRQKELMKKIRETVKLAVTSNPEKPPRIVVQAPCGFGKTPLMVTMINGAVEKGKKVLFLAPRKELISQCSKMLKSWGVEHGILNNPKKSNVSALVQLSCPLTVANRNFSTWEPDLIFYDECHGSLSDTALQVMNKFPKAFVFGFSATPYRDDGRGLKEFYDHIVTSCQTNDLIKDGLLIEPEYHKCSETVTATKAITFNSDSEESSTIEADLVINADLIRNFQEICPKAQTVVFCSSMSKAEDIAEKFRKAGYKANSVDSLTPAKEREQILHDFEHKKFQILCNAMLLKEGWDYPELECVIILRNLKSRTFYRQACGRCMRVPKNNPNKKAYILDFFNCISTFGRPWDDEEYTLEETIFKDPKKTDEEQKGEQGGICVQCRDVLYPGVNVCPNCGFDNPKQNKLVVEAIADLEKVESSTKIITKSDKQIEFDKLCAKCMNKEHNPGSVAHKYKQIFDVWPKGLSKSEKWEQYVNDYNRTKLNKKFNIQEAMSTTEFVNSTGK